MGTEPATRVLVVEDDANMAAGVVRGLRGAGLDVERSTDGADAARRMLAERYDIVVLDLMLPGLASATPGAAAWDSPSRARCASAAAGASRSRRRLPAGCA
jgi:CheY-like chemotaxis protein